MARFYVYRNGEEVTNHPAHNRTYSGLGPFTGTHGKYRVRDTLYLADGRGGTELKAETANPDGPVMVKVWYGPGDTAWFVFASAAQLAAATAGLKGSVAAMVKKEPVTVHFDRTEYLETKMEAYSNDRYEKVPFTCEPGLADIDVMNKLHSIVYGKYKPSHFGGCGYACHVSGMERTAPTGGYATLCHYQGIGD